MRASVYIKEKQRIERLGQFLSKALVESFSFPAAPIQARPSIAEKQGEALNKPPKFRIFKGKHLLASVLWWKLTLDSLPELHSPDFTKQVGLRAIRIRHLLQLSRLNPGIVEAILNMPPAQAKRRITTKSLERIFRLRPSGQARAFNSLSPLGQTSK